MAKPLTIARLFGRRNPTVYTVETSLLGKFADDKGPDPFLLYGVELEIENASSDWTVDGMQWKEDGSLRNEGLEFITQPMHYTTLSRCLSTFFETELDSDNYSERCSIHVHANCLDMTLQQVTTLLMMYQTFEQVLFHFIDNNSNPSWNRQQNIFCVPWSETQLTFRALQEMAEGNYHLLHRWQKYTALNLIPLGTQGTIEFRHMGGTNDLTYINMWLRIIGHLFRVAKSYEFDFIKSRLVNLNTTSQYDAILDFVFAECADSLRTFGYHYCLENGVLNLKYALAPTADTLGSMAASERREAARQRNRQWVEAQVPNGANPVPFGGAGELLRRAPPIPLGVFDEAERIVEAVGGLNVNIRRADDLLRRIDERVAARRQDILDATINGTQAPVPQFNWTPDGRWIAADFPRNEDR